MRAKLSQVLFTLSIVGLLIPGPASPQATAQNKTEVRRSITDVKLKGASLNGRLISPEGKVVSKQAVRLLQNQKELSTTTTSPEGTFAFRGLKTGVYQVQVNEKTANVRVWSEKAAPKTAKTGVILVDGSITRAQLDDLQLTPLDGALIGLGIAGLTTGIVAIDKANDNEDAINNIPTSP